MPTKPELPPATAAELSADCALQLLPPRFRQLASLNTAEVCEVLRVGRAALHKAIRRGDWPPPLKLAHRAVWPTSTVAAQLKARLDAAEARQQLHRSAH